MSYLFLVCNLELVVIYYVVIWGLVKKKLDGEKVRCDYIHKLCSAKGVDKYSTEVSCKGVIPCYSPGYGVTYLLFCCWFWSECLS